MKKKCSETDDSKTKDDSKKLAKLDSPKSPEASPVEAKETHFFMAYGKVDSFNSMETDLYKVPYEVLSLITDYIQFFGTLVSFMLVCQDFYEFVCSEVLNYGCNHIVFRIEQETDDKYFPKERKMFVKNLCFYSFAYDEYVLKILKFCGNIHELDLESCVLIGDDLFKSPSLKSLECLNVSGCKHLTDNFVIYLSKVKSNKGKTAKPILRKLVIRDLTRITDKAFEYLKGIEFLDMKNCDQEKITTKGIQCLGSSIKKLVMRCCDQNSIKDEAFKPLTNLVRLDLKFCSQFTGNILKYLKGIKYIDLTFTKIKYTSLLYEYQQVIDNAVEAKVDLK